MFMYFLLTFHGKTKRKQLNVIPTNIRRKSLANLQTRFFSGYQWLSVLHFDLHGGRVFVDIQKQDVG